MANNFPETVAMDLKFCHGKILLHIIYHCTRSTVASNKNPDTTVQTIFKIWISVNGSPEKFATDNRGEFAKNFIQLCKSFGITVKTTAVISYLGAMV